MPASPPLPEVSDADWAATPPSVRALVRAMAAQIERLETRVRELEERLGTTSHNSSKPPSSDGPAVAKPRKPPTGRKPGGQPGHKGHRRALRPTAACDAVVSCAPTACRGCARALRGTDPAPDRHQVTEVPPIVPTVTEYQLHTLVCGHCGTATRGALPDGVPTGAFGPRVQATAALLAGVYRLSHRAVAEALRDFFGVTMSVGSVTACERATSAALAVPVTEARAAARTAPVAHVDETGWREARGRAWLWVMSTALVTVFLVHTRRNTAAATALLRGFAGYLVTDRWKVYDRWSVWMRQLCWAHLKRDFVKISERRGASGRLGTALLAEVTTMFTWWHRVRDGTLPRATFVRQMRLLRARVEVLLCTGRDGDHARTAATCREILKLRAALWTFVEVEGVEPTNNTAERQVRRGVLWRRTSFGTHSAAGSRFAERILTTAATLRQQHRNVVEFVMRAVDNRLHGRPSPSLLPADSNAVSHAAAA